MNWRVFLKKTSVIALLAALGLAAAPMAPVFAAGTADPTTPPAGQHPAGTRLELLWARQHRLFERQGRMLERSAEMLDKTQELIDRAEADGKDVTGLQAALDEFESALDEAQGVHESGQALIDEHAGFDNAGKVTDESQAADTVRAVAQNLEQVRSIIGPAARAFHDAFRAFREANRPAQPTP
ncbi:MAG TPA: hypothetical protein VGJ22_04935 [Anaerolineales bacterium]|jgi:hypothetical protein